MSNLYETDFVVWLQQQAELIRNGQIDKLDLPNIADELEGLARQERQLLRESIDNVLEILVARQFPEETAGIRDGTTSLIEDRFDIKCLLERSPSLANRLPTIIAEEWDETVTFFSEMADIPRDRFPKQCPWTIEQLLDMDFLPN